MEKPLRQLVWDPSAESREHSARSLAPLVPATERVISEVTSEGLLLHASSELDVEIVVDRLRAIGHRLEVGKPQINFIQGNPWQEPYATLDIRFPSERFGDVMQDLRGRRAEVLGYEILNPGEMHARALAPMAELFGYSAALRMLTRGKGSFEQEFLEYRPFPRD